MKKINLNSLQLAHKMKKMSLNTLECYISKNVYIKPKQNI